MQAIDKIGNETNWITVLLVFLFVCIFLLKVLNVQKLRGYAFSLINIGFIESEIEESSSFFNRFQSAIFVFSMLVLSLLIYKIILFYSIFNQVSFYGFLKVFSITFSYFIFKWLLEYLLSILFLIRKEVRFFLALKSSYLYSVSFLLFVGIIITEYSKLNLKFLIYFALILLLLRLIFYIVNNKKLIFNKLFYFILYICAFEIAPLFILFKLMF